VSRDRDDDDRPRRSAKKGKRRKSAGPTVLPWVIAAAAVLVLGGVGFVAMRMLTADKPAVGGGPGAAARPGVAELPAAARTGVKYVPHESERKMGEFLETIGDRRATEAEVFAIMGEPTRIDGPDTVRKHGHVFVVYEAFWEVPGSGISSRMVFSNGVESGMILGLEVTPRK
jgi:hypothetical protein